MKSCDDKFNVLLAEPLRDLLWYSLDINLENSLLHSLWSLLRNSLLISIEDGSHLRMDLKEKLN